MTNSTIIVVLFIVGVMAIVVEMFVPGLIIGMMGFVLCAISIVMAFQAENASLGWTLAVTGMVLVPILVVVWFKVFTTYFAVNTTEEGQTAATEEDEELLGKEGVTLTKLRPAGVARIAERRVDVMADGEMIEKGVRIEVIKVEGNRVLVRSKTV